MNMSKHIRDIQLITHYRHRILLTYSNTAIHIHNLTGDKI